MKNKVIVITGGTKGLGKALAIFLREKEAKIIICARNEKEFNNFPENEYLCIKADVTVESDLQKVVEIVKDKFNQLDFWINNAGIWLPDSLVEEIDWSKAHNVLEVNLFGTMYGSKASLVQMKEQGFGTIVNIISTSALRGRSRNSVYCASKYAVDGFTKSLREEVKGTDIKILSVYPGGMQTSFFNEKKPDDYEDYMDSKSIAQKIIENLLKNTPEEEMVIRRPSS